MKIELDATEEKLVSATFGIIRREGFKGATTKKIASEAGVNEVTIFRKFKNKKNLIEITKDYYIQKLLEKLGLTMEDVKAAWKQNASQPAKKEEKPKKQDKKKKQPQVVIKNKNSAMGAALMQALAGASLGEEPVTDTKENTKINSPLFCSINLLSNH